MSFKIQKESKYMTRKNSRSEKKMFKVFYGFNFAPERGPTYQWTLDSDITKNAAIYTAIHFCLCNKVTTKTKQDGMNKKHTIRWLF